MSPVERTAAAVDLRTLPDYSFGATSVGFWGVIAFMLIEGMGFALAIGAYFYLLPFERHWPPYAAPPPLFWATAGVVVVLLSEIPNVLSVRRAKAFDERGTQACLVAISLVGLVLLGLRALEFEAFNVRWDRNAYASICWALLVMHVLDLITDVYDSIVLAVLAIVHPLDGRRYSDVEDNALFWHFVVVTWVIVYVIVYWVPRWT
jgi:heme/copper-type cytochrome/quinol oxidase subunit 3